MRHDFTAGHFISSLQRGWRSLSRDSDWFLCPTRALKGRPTQQASSAHGAPVRRTLWETRALTERIEGRWLRWCLSSLPGRRNSQKRGLKKDQERRISGTEATSGLGVALGDAGDRPRRVLGGPQDPLKGPQRRNECRSVT